MVHAVLEVETGDDPKKEVRRMYRFKRSMCSGLIVAASLSISVGAAHAQEATAPPVLSVVQVRDAFSTAGYQLDQAQNWNWTTPQVTSFQVHDSSTGRVVMVLVYPSTTVAQAALLEAETHEQAVNGGAAIANGGAPHLVIGYGRSVWDGNVAMVQTTEAAIAREYQAQIDRDNGLNADPSATLQGASPESSVDLDFLQALQQGTVNL
jgi:hypothetical protein